MNEKMTMQKKPGQTATSNYYNFAGAHPVEILLVEDNPAQARLMLETLKDSKLHNNLHMVNDGVEALEFLRREGAFADVPRPDLILLDLNLPKKDGRQVLREIKADENLKRIPVIILTTSEAGADILMAYNLHANCFITKPVDLDQLIKVVQSIQDFWLTIVKLPAE